MKEILIFAGTTEGRKLSEYLAAADSSHTICVATEYGELILTEHEKVKIKRGRMTQEEIASYLLEGDFAAVVDATHPYATVITENIQRATKETQTPYLRLKRDCEISKEQVTYFESKEACARALKEVRGNILLTTGSKDLAAYCEDKQVTERLYVRVLPSYESLILCMEQGICANQILALQGPFSVELNHALLQQYQIACLVTKASGKVGGYTKKLEAAKQAGIPVYVVGQPEEENGYTFAQVCQALENLCEMKITRRNSLDIQLVGVGMGNRNHLTMEAADAIANADILLGAKRMITPYTPKLEKHAFYQADQIIPYLRKIQADQIFVDSGKVVVLFSGDSGFYSGCQTLYHALQKEVVSGQLEATIRILPGISSVSYLAACLGESYQDVAIYSMHGKEVIHFIQKIQSAAKVFLLLSGVADLKKLGELLMEANMRDCEVMVGYQLSYPEQEIKKLSPIECCTVKGEGLYTCMIHNPRVKERRLTPGMVDAEFMRERIPMTKEEVRAISICKLGLTKTSVVYDVGSGTGSMAIEMANLSHEIRVVAMERNPEAVLLIKKNIEKVRLENIRVVSGEAPDVFEGMPVPTHVWNTRIYVKKGRY